MERQRARAASGSAPNFVFAWHHENDSRTWVAPDLATYLDRRPTGRIAS
ncbi:hypothetical protein [Streptomyces sp. col6]|nr:hypothetical protein [Streptomyces sp. col6]